MRNTLMMPNFLIVGAAKSGTTSLYRYLKQHPDIFMPEWKEPSFFVGAPYKPLNHATESIYFSLFRNVKHEKAIGEASAAYLYDQWAPALVKKRLGNVKIIILLRNPVDMSYSLFNHQCRKEGENLNSFEEGLAMEDSRIRDPAFKETCYGWHANYYYFKRALYSDQVRRYLDNFSHADVMLILFEDLMADPLGIAQKTFGFLNVNDSFVPEIKIHNPAGGQTRIPAFWRDYGLFLQTCRFVFSKNMFKKVPLIIKRIGKKPPAPIRLETARKLRNRLYGDICQLEKLIGADLSAWKNS